MSQKQAPDGMVVRVIDGDTIVVQQDGKPETVRLIGVDTPEEVDRRKPVQYYAREAAWFTTQIALNHQVRLEVQERPSSRDRYGRLLAYAFRQSDGLFINKEIIIQGFGFAYVKSPFDPQRMAEFRAAERDAREQERGLWAPVVKGYDKINVPKPEPRAESWIKMGDNLASTNPAAANGWYQKVLSEYPRSTQEPIARERMRLPPKNIPAPPPLDGEVAMSILLTLAEFPVARPSLPAPPRSPGPAEQQAEQTEDRELQGATEGQQTGLGSAPTPSGRSYSSRGSAGTEVHVRGYTRKNGTYGAPYTRSSPGSGSGGKRGRG